MRIVLVTLLLTTLVAAQYCCCYKTADFCPYGFTLKKSYVGSVACSTLNNGNTFGCASCTSPQNTFCTFTSETSCWGDDPSDCWPSLPPSQSCSSDTAAVRCQQMAGISCGALTGCREGAVGPINCPNCSAELDLTCSSNTCVCSEDITCNPGDCRTKSNNCGNIKNCGTCPSGQVCTSAFNGQCCTPAPLTCSCGNVTDSCGQIQACPNSCESGQQCVSNACQEAESDVDSGTIAGAVIGGLIVIIILVVCIVLILWVVKKTPDPTARKQTKAPQPNSEYEAIVPKGSGQTSTQSPYGGYKSTDGIQAEYLKNVEVKERVGGGQFGDVFKGMWMQTPIAAKRLKGKEDFEEFKKEAKVLSQIRHVHVVLFLGLYIDNDNNEYIVTEYCDNGSVLDSIRKRNYTVAELLTMGLECAKGMDFLESKSIVHRDLSCRNLLLDKSNRVKIADFGLSRMLESSYYTSATAKFPLRWAAKEVIQFKKFSIKSDIWSFGIVLWELMTRGQLPYPGMNNEAVVDAILNQKYRMAAPVGCPEKLYQLMLKCWAEGANDRPSFDVCGSILTDIIDSLPAEGMEEGGKGRDYPTDLVNRGGSENPYQAPVTHNS